MMKRLAAIKNVGVVFGLVIVFFAVGSSSSQAAHIEEFFELVQDADQVVWLNDQNETLVLDQGDVGDPVRISHGEKIDGLFGKPDGGMGIYFPESQRAPVIDVFVGKQQGTGKAVLAVHETRLPFARMIQAQVGYDLLLDPAGVMPDGELSLAVETRASADSPWQSAARFGGELLNSAESGSISSIHHVANQRFRTHFFAADLTPWAGKYVRLTFAMRFSSSSSGLCRARILQAKLIKSDIRVEFAGEPEPVFYAPGLGTRMKSAKNRNPFSI